MRPLRRNDLNTRFELLPLIDVLFVLLTFFIYNQLSMVRAEVMPVRLPALQAGAQATGAGQIVAISIGAAGELFINREPVTVQELEMRLRAIAAEPVRPAVYLAMEAQGTADRGPLFIDLIERVRLAGIEDFVIVGQPKPGRGL